MNTDTHHHGDTAIWEAETSVERRQSAYKPAHAPIQVVCLQHPHVWVGGMEVVSDSDSGTKRRKFENGECDNRQDSPRRSSKRQDFRHSGVDPVKTTAMVGTYSEAWTRKADQAFNIRNVQKTHRR